MGESKRRQDYRNVLADQAVGHRPPPGMQNVSGALLVDFARDVQALIEAMCDKGVTPNAASLALVALGVDNWRANYGDSACLSAVTITANQRLAKPPEYWGVHRR